MEIWKDYNDFYEVSSYGNVKSKDRYVKSVHGTLYFKKGRILKQADNGQGYLQLMLCINGKNRTERVHRLVALTFIPNPLGLPKVNHIDGNKRNNNINNLEWCTQLENIQCAKEQGLMIKGTKANNSKLNEACVVEIRGLIKEGYTNREIGDIFNVHAGTISCIRLGRNWSHVK